MGDDPGRRTVLFGGAAVAVGMGGLNPRPLNAPPAGQPGVGVQPGSLPTVATRIIVASGNPGTGFFEYAGVPRLGNPPTAWAVAAGVTTDPFGNPLPLGLSGGFATTDGTGAAHVVGAELDLINVLGSPTGACSLASVDIGGSTNLRIQTAGVSGGGVGSGLAYYTAPNANGNTFTAAADPSTLINPESWHAPTTTGFGTVAGAQPVEYTLNANGMVEITGVMAASGAYTAGTTIWTMPAAYRPTTNIASVSVDIDTGGAFTAAIAQVTSAGLVSIPINVAGAAEVFFSGGSYRLPL